MKNNFLKAYILLLIMSTSSNAVLWSLSHASVIKSTITSDIEEKMTKQIEEVVELKKYYEDEIKLRAEEIKKNKINLNKLDLEIQLMMKKIENQEHRMKRLLI